MEDKERTRKSKRALATVAVSGYNGLQGSGKELLVRIFPSILPVLAFTKLLELTKIYRISRVT